MTGEISFGVPPSWPEPDFTGGEATTHSAAETQELGSRFAALLGPGELVALSGELGAGKTCFIQGICIGLGVEDTVNSPTFILMNQYSGQRDGIAISICHFDFYRLSGAGELDSFGAEEFFDGEGICLVEWAERAAERLPPRRWQVEMEYAGTGSRSLRFCKLGLDS